MITNQVHVSKKHNSADVVTICMLLLQWHIYHQTLVSKVRFLLRLIIGIAQLDRAQPLYAGSSPAPDFIGMAKMVNAKH